MLDFRPKSASPCISHGQAAVLELLEACLVRAHAHGVKGEEGEEASLQVRAQEDILYSGMLLYGSWMSCITGTAAVLVGR